MPRKQQADARWSDIKGKFLERVAELWDTHQEKFVSVLDESEQRKINVTFRGALDFSESTASLVTSIAYVQAMKDKKSDSFEDPNQPNLPLDNAGPSGRISGGEGEHARDDKSERATSLADSFSQEPVSEPAPAPEKVKAKRGAKAEKPAKAEKKKAAKK